MKIQPLIKDFLEYLVTQGKRPTTATCYGLYLKRFVDFTGNLDIKDIGIKEISDFQNHISGLEMAPATKSYHSVALRSFLKYCHRQGLVTIAPDVVELPKVSRKILDCLSDQEVKALLGAIESKTNEGIRARAIIETLLCTGMRVSELCHLTLKDVDFDNQRAVLHGCKNGKERNIFFSRSAIEALKKYLEVRHHQTDFLISTYGVRGPEMISSRSIQRLVKSYAEKAGIHKKISPHSLRRTFAMQMLRKNVDIRHIQKFLGHSDLNTTQYYTNVSGVELEKVYRLADNRMVNNTPDGIKNEFVMLSKDNFYSIIGAISKNRSLLIKLCRKFEISCE
jgi:site-specific recombinase XerD